MRDLLDLLDSLTEARGLSGRVPGETYSRGPTADDQITFKSLTFYPDVGSYATPDEFMDAWTSVEQATGHPIEKVNQPNAGMRAFAIAAFDTAVGTRYLAKFTKEIKPVRAQNTFFKPKTFLAALDKLMLADQKKKPATNPAMY